MDDALRAYLADIGRKGGQAKSPAKTAAAKRNIARRWKNRPKPARPPRKRRQAPAVTSAAPGTARQASAAPSLPPAVKVGRNDPCPCNSGRKFKRCCGAVA